MPTILTLQTKKYTLNLDNFQGPLDLLCNLIEKNKMNIYDIKLDEITDQYLEYLNKAKELNLEIASEFVSMASTLLYIKSKKLLPGKDDEEEEISEDELIRRIIEYKKYKDITEKLRKNFEKYSNRLYKFPEDIELPKQQLEEEYEQNIISKIYEELWNKNQNKVNENAKNIEKIAITESYSVSDKVKEIFKVLVKRPKFVFNKLFSLKEKPKEEVVTAFSGVLELSRRNKIIAEQEETFGDITISKRKNSK